MPSSSSTSKTKSTSSKKERTPSFVCEIPLRVTPADEHALNVRLNAARQVYNACLGEDNLLHVDTARERWSGAEPLLRAAWSNATQPANGRLRPSSFGVMPRSQSGSSAELGTAHAEARDAVAAAQAAGESPGVVAVVPSEPPGFSRGEAQ